MTKNKTHTQENVSLITYIQVTLYTDIHVCICMHTTEKQMDKCND